MFLLASEVLLYSCQSTVQTHHSRHLTHLRSAHKKSPFRFFPRSAWLAALGTAHATTSIYLLNTRVPRFERHCRERDSAVTYDRTLQVEAIARLLPTRQCPILLVSRQSSFLSPQKHCALSGAKFGEMQDEANRVYCENFVTGNGIHTSCWCQRRDKRCLQRLAGGCFYFGCC